MPVWIRRTVYVLLAALGLVVLAWAFRPPPVPVDVETVAWRPMLVTVDEDGRTRIKERYVVSAPLGGRLRRIELDPGDPVLGDRTILAVIDPTDPRLLDARERTDAEARVRAAEASVRRAEAERERSRADYDFAEGELARARDAFARGGTNQRELEQRESDHRSAMEAFRSSQFSEEIAGFELEQARAALLHTRPGDAGAADGEFPIVAPVDGRVLRVLQESMSVVTPATPLLELGNPADLEVVIDVLSTDAVRIRPGDAVIIEHWGGDEPLEARVRLVEPSAFTKVSALGVDEQRVNVVADFVSPPEARPTLGDAFRVEARIVLWAGERVLAVPSSALFRGPGRGLGAVDPAGPSDGAAWFLFAVEEGRARRRPVRIGHDNGLVAEVLEGVQAGEVVIVQPGDTVVDGGRVEPRG